MKCQRNIVSRNSSLFSGIYSTKLYRLTCTKNSQLTMDFLKNLDSKVFSTGSQPPQKRQQGSLCLYGMRFCPFSQRPLIVLSLKEIPCEIVNINTRSKPEWYKNINPLAKVPSLETDEGILHESLVIAEYLDDVPSTNEKEKILPSDPFEKARQRMIIERLQNGLHHAYDYFHFKLDESYVQLLYKSLSLSEELLKDDFYGGIKPGWADYMLWPWFERLRPLAKLSDGKMKLDNYPRINSYLQRMTQQPEISRIAKSEEAHVHFNRSYYFGDKPDYDYLAD